MRFRERGREKSSMYWKQEKERENEEPPSALHLDLNSATDMPLTPTEREVVRETQPRRHE